MYKTKLQELCHKRGWLLPEYATAREAGVPDHMPRFHSTVTVNGQSFASQGEAGSSKQAQNDAAYLAFLHFSSPSPSPLPGSSAGEVSVDAVSNNSDILKSGGMYNVEVPKVIQTQEIGSSVVAAIPKNDDLYKEVPHVSKNHLQIYAQKNHLPLPVYSCERVGPPHCSRFKCKVTLNGQTYESPYLFPTVKEAESAAAKAALMSVPFDGVKEDDLSYKNLLQELAQKEGYPLPTYSTSSRGQAHMPTFISMVEIDSQAFTGEESKSKKAAELSAAKVAYSAIKSRNLSETHGYHVSVSQLEKALQCSSSNLLPDVTAYLQHNVQPQLPLPSETAEGKARAEVASHQQLALRAGEDVLPANGASSASGRSLLEQGSSSSSPADSPSTSVINSCIKRLVEQSALCRKGVVVHSRETMVAYPEGCTPSPMSNENWVVAKYTP